MSARLPAGSRRRLMTLAAPQAAADDNGGVTMTFQPVATLWARLVPRSQAMIFRNDEQGRNVTHDIYFRRRDGLTADMRLLLGSRVFQILSFEFADEKGVALQALCEEVTP